MTGLDDREAPQGAVAVRNLSKTFSGGRVLRNVNITFRQGEVHSVLGQNGSGKSTLVKILTGYHTPDPGASVHIRGQRVSLPVASASQLGIAVIHQDLALVNDLSVLENVGVVRSFGSSTFGPIRRSREEVIWNEMQERFGVSIDPRQLVGLLSPADRAFVAILRAIRQMGGEDAVPFLILDEPTAYLTRTDAERVHGLMASVCEAGGSVMFITHNLAEAIDVSDRLTVLVNGQVRATVTPDEVDVDAVISLMLDEREVTEHQRGDWSREGRRVLLSTRDLSGQTLSGFSFDLHEAEIVGVAGLAGMGQEELPYLLAGVQQPTHGQVDIGPSAGGVDGRPTLALIPADRARHGLWLDGSAAENITLPRLRSLTGRLGIRQREEQVVARAAMISFGAKPLSPNSHVRGFSGGNQQKIMLAKWISLSPQILVMHEPTQGVDIEARADIHELIAQVAADGTGVIVCSTDHEELARLCHRVITLKRGVIVCELRGADVAEDNILSAIS